MSGSGVVAAAALLLQAASLAPAASSRKLRVLCTHGYAQTGAVLRDRSGGFRKPLKKSKFECIYPDGPYGCTKDGENPVAAEADLSRRAWWRGHSGQSTYPGWEAACDDLGRLWSAGDHDDGGGGIDGVLGFSQGAAAAAMLTARYRPAFGIFVAGFVPADDGAVAQLLRDGVKDIPTLHVIGTSDTLVEPERSHALAACFEGSVIVEHPGGHMIPSSAVVRAEVKAFLEAHVLVEAAALAVAA